MVNRIQNRNPGYSDNLFKNPNIDNNTINSIHGATALKLDEQLEIDTNPSNISNETMARETGENVKTYHSETGFIGGMVVLNSGQISNEGSDAGKALESSLKDREALIITYWKSYDDHENSHKSETFQPLFQKVIDLCENGNEEIVYDMLWQGEAYSPEMAKMAQTAKEENS